MSKERVELSTLAAGENFRIGDYDFIVLEQDMKEGRTMVISQNLLEENVRFDENSRDYKTSNVKKIIEEKIQPEIEVAVGVDNLIEHEVELTSVDMQTEFGTYMCKVRPITFDEARKYNDLLANEEMPDWYWTCTPWSTEKRGWGYSIAVVSPSGIIYSYYYDGNDGVRPFCILKSNIFVSKGEK